MSSAKILAATVTVGVLAAGVGACSTGSQADMAASKSSASASASGRTAAKVGAAREALLAAFRKQGVSAGTANTLISAYTAAITKNGARSDFPATGGSHVTAAQRAADQKVFIADLTAIGMPPKEATNLTAAYSQGVPVPASPAPATQPAQSHAPSANLQDAQFGSTYALVQMGTNGDGAANLIVSAPVVNASLPIAGTGASMTPGNGEYISFKITLEATASGAAYNPIYWVASTTDGGHYTVLPGMKAPSLDVGELVKGQLVTGYVTFDFPAGSHGTLLYGALGQPTIGQWKF
jgi:hypothetical protein